eukprot:m.1136750 g.1136750  ORF g.1136750 m.1136750 type:complete len:331 (+) comp24433_c0_seq10:152-1144(+)
MSTERAPKRPRHHAQSQPSTSIVSEEAATETCTAQTTSKKADKRRKSKNPCRPKTVKKTSTTIENDEGVETALVDGLRWILPYAFPFETYAKGRWIGRTLIEVFSTEFQSQSAASFKRGICSGVITVNGRKVDPEYIVCESDLITNRVHRHEPPVSAQSVQIVFEDDDVVAVDKPSSVPVHPCGRYRHNTMLGIIGREHGKWNLLPCHRLDRLTSGILVFAKTKAAAQRIQKQIETQAIKKTYLCKVRGVFPTERTECHAPIKTISYKLGVCTVDPAGKECSTVFTRRGVTPDGCSISAPRHQVVCTKYVCICSIWAIPSPTIPCTISPS